MAMRFDESACRERLLQGAEMLDLALTKEQVEKLLQFLALLAKWNQAYNLTAVRNPLEMVARHLLDSLAVVPHLEGRRCLDMGTGPGLPGIPLAVIRPEIEFVLLDSNNKKVRFVRQAILELGLNNVEAVHTRVEDYQPANGFDMLISRAFTSLPNMLDLTAGLRRKDTVLLAMKAIVPQDELQTLEIENNCRVIPLKVPCTEGQRCLIRFSPAE
ncbi:MAG: 16S rRNA (guanine(527)-N(7))-methyltransferase RsmG [Candidatus Thiodiazotropha sp. (ex Gloverina cf. vestifex)]|nr:16S rRNA (guanine(527)-N(7))-methyltransferase RsmG [Candidatus Thiodiazotropha sp. (ex Gloverina cf. vestifex)]